MEKLTLKKLVGYLPYGLKAYCNEDIHDVTLEDEMDGYSICVRDVLENNHKLVLRTLSNLTKEITQNGETFVPIFKLAEIAMPDLSWKELRNKSINENLNIAEFDFPQSPDIVFGTSVNSGGKKTTDFYGTIAYELIGIDNQLQLFQKLYEWHFDIHGLIEKGKAIDINTL